MSSTRAGPTEEQCWRTPHIPDRGSYGLPDLHHGPQFGAVIRDLMSARFVTSSRRSSTPT